MQSKVGEHQSVNSPSPAWNRTLPGSTMRCGSRNTLKYPNKHVGRTADVHTLSVTCSARIRRMPLHFDTCDDADTCPSLATTDCGQQRRRQRRSDLRKVAHSISPITLPVGNALARWQLTTRRATRPLARHWWECSYPAAATSSWGFVRVGGFSCGAGRLGGALPPARPWVGGTQGRRRRVICAFACKRLAKRE